jgi:retron-type reverse transcriptase
MRCFYDSIDVKILLSKVGFIIQDARFLTLVELLIKAHKPGISTGSCLSPALSNIYLADFDREIEDNSVFFSRYVDDMLVAPVSSIELIKAKLAEVGLEINTDKSKPVNAAEGFKFLGFDIKRDVERTLDTAIQNGDFALAE